MDYVEDLWSLNYNYYFCYLIFEGIVLLDVEWCVLLEVLSVCDIDKGKVICEGVFSLVCVFLLGGVFLIIVLQWKVDDNFVFYCMVVLYVYMIVGQDVVFELCEVQVYMIGISLFQVYQCLFFLVMGLGIVFFRLVGGQRYF